MRKLRFMMLMLIFLQACSGFAPAPTNTAGPTATATVSLTPIDTATASITPTLTASPTIVHIPTQDPNLPTATFMPIPIFIGENTATPIVPPTPIKPGPGFDTVTISDPKIFWGNCKPNRTKILATVDDPDEVTSVVVFVQLKSTKKDDYTPWSSGNVMFDHRNGTFSYTLEANEIEGHNHYKDSWIRYQLVATDAEENEIGRTMIYPQSIILSPCMCYEPLAPGGCPIVTPRPAP